jgi:flavodoxin
MKFLVTYWSKTGNTQKVAEAIFNALPSEKSLKPLDEVENLDEFDLTFLGFPVMQFGVPAAAKQFIADKTPGKQIALFVTHAMLSEGDDTVQQAMLAKELDKCCSAFSQSTLMGFFHCQGELSEAMANELLSGNIPMLVQFAAMRPLTIGHPNRSELDEAGKFALKMVSQL